MDSKQNTVAMRPSLAEEVAEWLRAFPAEFADCWQRLPNKGLFFVLAAAWLLLFQFLGNSTFGYTNTNSLMHWMYNAYNSSQSDGQDAHGNYIPFVVIALMWWKRKELLALQIRSWWPGLLLLAGALLLHIIGYRLQQPRVSIVAFFAGLYALMGLAWGSSWLRASLFPFFLFAFCIPIASIGEPITFPLRHLVARIVQFICNKILFLDVVREGTQLFNSTHTYGYEVAAACSGLRSMVAVLAISTIYGFLTFRKNWKRITMMLAAFPLAVVGNVARMLCIILTAEISGQKAGNFVHENWFFSIVPYLLAFGGVYLLGRWLAEPEAAPPSTATTTPST
ncbi:MAG TPA: exosortase/archaeosortase family protein [Verrucomicrobiae bacterium]|nr:exosortase/archaeosortase family protein [Verrucomicrobiae bacterium]